jgi:hypothetical protein
MVRIDMFLFFNVVRAIPHQLPSGQDLVGPGFFCCDEFSSPPDNKNSLPTPTKGFLRIFLKFAIPPEKKS